MNTHKLLDHNHATLKLLFVAALSLAMLIPLFMVRSIVTERQNLQLSAGNTIANRWGGPQSIGGLVVLTNTPARFIPDKDSRARSEWRATVLSDLEIKTSMVTEQRYLGIYEVPVYTTRVTIEGRLDWHRINSFQPQGNLLLWLPLSDVRGVREISSLKLGSLEIPARPLGVHTNTISGLQFMVPAQERQGLQAEEVGDYRLELKLAGSDSLLFLPLADTTRVTLDADWPHPEFVGQYLPTERDITASGVRANWQLLGLNRPYGDIWAVADMPFQQLNQAGFGMRLETPVDGYQRSERSVKYGFLFISLTFFTLFLFEVMTGHHLHPVPYVLTGAALAVFYLVLLALSEYLPFAGAFALAAGLLVGIVTPYTGAVLGQRRRGYLVGAMLAVTYALLYLLVSAQHAALLLGSLALLLAIAGLMYLTRGVDWYAYGGDD
jgi:inner membrane protein